jgi:NTP pyrophosphatase (non-canonical NTP hydrolase)
VLKTFEEFQEHMAAVYGKRDEAQGVEGIAARLVEELGELLQAVRKQPWNRTKQRQELGDMLTWVASLATQINVRLEESVQRYREGCPYCGQTPCSCDEPPHWSANRSLAVNTPTVKITRGHEGNEG